MMGLLPKLLLTVVIACCVMGCLLYMMQEKLIFHPERLRATHAFSFPVPFEEAVLTSGGVKLHSLRFPKENSRGVVLYFHGNAGSLNSWGHVYADFASLPYDLWILDYRGFGKSEGTISGERELHEDALVLYTAAQQAYAGKDIVIYGRSIGTGIAAKLAAEHPPELLILETPYFNFPDLVSQVAPWAPEALLRYRLMTNEYIADQSFPIHLIHGDRDTLIPVASSERLATLGPHIRYHRIAGAGHNNISAFSQYERVLRSVFAGR